jgi:KUP system potassium uptake protein
MKNGSQGNGLERLSLAGVIITLGIVFGDLGTSPLYVMKAIVTDGGGVNDLLIFGSLSCIFWTLTLLTTVKYIIITLRVDNKGEGGIFALFAMMKKKSPAIAFLTMIGGGALLADGIITPAITVTSSIEGLRIYNQAIPVVPIVLVIFAALFFMQQFGTKFVGGSFGPIMAIWFGMLGILGAYNIIFHPQILEALNPAWAIKFLSHYPKAFILLGAIFLCTTGAEALYSDLGHCGLKNIRVSWGFVKLALVLNYFGQGAWLLTHPVPEGVFNPFFSVMPVWFLLPGIIIATAAAIIASQALISGSYTLVSEAISLNFWPKNRVLHPTEIRGQVYIPFVNWFLWIACSFVVIFFRESKNMEAAYGLAITLTMIMTTLLLSNYYSQKKIHWLFIGLLLLVFLTIECSFLIANLHKFKHGGWFTLTMATLFVLIMYGWYFGRKIKNSHITFANLNDYMDLFKELSHDESVPKTATNLVYLMKANRLDHVESKIIYSIFFKQPKRADTYWFLHVNITNEPNQFTYEVHHIIPGILIKIDFNIGFKMEPRINLYFKEVLEDLVKSGEIRLTSHYDSLMHHDIPGDFLFVNLDRIMSRDHKLSTLENITLTLHSIARKISINDVRALGLDTTNTIEEKIPIAIERPVSRRIRRVAH